MKHQTVTWNSRQLPKTADYNLKQQTATWNSRLLPETADCYLKKQAATWNSICYLKQYSAIWNSRLVSPDMLFHGLLIASGPKYILETLTSIQHGKVLLTVGAWISIQTWKPPAALSVATPPPSPPWDVMSMGMVIRHSDHIAYLRVPVPGKQ